MKFRFLCATHRLQLISNPKQAIHCWQDGFDTGQNFYDQKLWADALPHFGCAYESSEIIMATKFVERVNCYEFFSSSAVFLVDTFIKLGCIEQAEKVRELALRRLEQELPDNKKESECLSRHLGNIHKNSLYGSIIDLVRPIRVVH